MLTVDELAAEAAAISMVAIEEADRDEFAVALVLQGYEPRRAHQMAYETLADNDGALQMLARQRRRVAWAAALPKEGEETKPEWRCISCKRTFISEPEPRRCGYCRCVDFTRVERPTALSSLPVSGEVEKLRDLSEKASKGPWEVESEPDPDAEYGPGPDPGRGFDDFMILAAEGGKILGTENATHKSIQEEYGEDDVAAWDEIGQANAAFVVAAVNYVRAALTPQQATDSGVDLDPPMKRI